MRRKITDKQISQLREMYSTGKYNQKQIAKKLGISPFNVNIYKKYDSLKDYTDKKAKEKGFRNHTKYRKHLAKKNGFKHRIEYEKYLAKKNGTLTQFLIKERLRSNLREALRRYTKMGKIQSSSKYGLDYNAIIENLTPFPQNTAEYDIDHLIPLSLYDLEDKKEVKKSFNPQNLRWLMKRENIQKSNNLRKQDLELIAQIPKKLYPKSGIVQIALRS